MELKIQRIHENAKLPLYQHKGDAGLDIFSSIDCVLEAGEVKPVPTGMRMAVPDGYVGLVWDKSGISLRGVHRLRSYRFRLQGGGSRSYGESRKRGLCHRERDEDCSAFSPARY